MMGFYDLEYKVEYSQKYSFINLLQDESQDARNNTDVVETNNKMEENAQFEDEE